MTRIHRRLKKITVLRRSPQSRAIKERVAKLLRRQTDWHTNVQYAHVTQTVLPTTYPIHRTSLTCSVQLVTTQISNMQPETHAGADMCSNNQRHSTQNDLRTSVDNTDTVTSYSNEQTSIKRNGDGQATGSMLSRRHDPSEWPRA
jgi:superfamily II helicase